MADAVRTFAVKGDAIALFGLDEPEPELPLEGTRDRQDRAMATHLTRCQSCEDHNGEAPAPTLGTIPDPTVS
jgi:hypothetical protein